MCRHISLVFFILLTCQFSANAQDRADWSGTGFFINTAGWLVTNYHVIEGCSRVEVDGYGEALSVANDRQHDLALIKVSPKRAIETLALSAARPRLGEEVVAVGYPLYPYLSSDPKVTMGNVNSLSPISDAPHLMQHSAPIQPGNSGGPLLDLSGHVVGVNVSRMTSDANRPELQNVNFAIQPEFIASFVERQGLKFERATFETRLESIADVAEQGARASVLILCFGGQQPEDEFGNEEPDVAGEAEWYLALYPDLDFWGADIVDKGLETESAVECAIACANEPQCRVFTFNQSQNRCFMKSRVDISILSDGAQSGVFLPPSSRGQASPIIAEFVMRNRASYSFLSNPLLQPRRSVKTLDACLRSCRENGSCNFTTFTFGNRAPCRSWSAIPGGLVANRKSVTFDKIDRSVSPVDVVPLN